MTFDAEQIMPPGARIKVVGIGGGGGNAVNTMIRSNIEGVEFMTANTDVQALRFALAPNKIQIGKELTKGLGAGADPDIGRDAALEDRHEIQEMVSGADMVFITAGMGGGTGTGGAGVIAQIAREAGALTVGVVTKPFNFEGKRRRRHAEAGIARLRENVDTLIIIPNQRLLQVATPDLTMIDAFKLADDVLVNAVRGISDIINVPGTVNVDFADVKTVMSCMGQALMGIGISEGENRALDAATQAIASPLLEDVDIEGATGLLINITAGSSISLMEVNEACSIVQEAAHEDANIIFGAVIDENMGDSIRVTVIATGFPGDLEDDDEARVDGTPRSRIVLPNATSASISARGELIESSFSLTSKSKQYQPLSDSNYSGLMNGSKNPLDTTPLGSSTRRFSNELPSKSKQSSSVRVPSFKQEIAKSIVESTASVQPNSASDFERKIETKVETKDNSDAHMVVQPGSETQFGGNLEVSLNQEVNVDPIGLDTDAKILSSKVSKANSDHRALENDYAPISETDELTRLTIEGLNQSPDLHNEITEEDVVINSLDRDIRRVEVNSTNEVAIHPSNEVGKPAFSPDPFCAPKDLSKPKYIDSLLMGASTKQELSVEGSEEESSTPLESFFEEQESDCLSKGINQTIDDALEMASRIETEKEKESDDDLDVPAFLRHGVKDLPLG